LHSSSPASANADHSHSHKNLLKGEAPTGASSSDDPARQNATGRAQRPAIAITPELAAYVAKRMT
jgi:hypothetical protein